MKNSVIDTIFNGKISLKDDKVAMDIIWEKAENEPFLKPYIDVMKSVGYNSKWHLEGSVWQHTKNVVDEMAKICPWKKDMILAAFFHDFGKSKTGEQRENGDWSFHCHDSVGEKLVREILWDEDMYLRENICAFIKYHMQILQIYDSKKIEEKLYNIISSFNGNIYDLIKLKQADCRGSKMAVYDNFEEKLNTIKEIADKLIIKEKEMNKKDFNIFIMCGIAGSGKSTYISNNLSYLPVVSRDLIRENLKMAKKGEKFVGTREQETLVTKLEYEQIEEFCKNKNSFIVDDMNLQKKYRNQLINFVKKFNPSITIIYVEAPSIEDNIKRREGMISSDIIKSMIHKLDFPTKNECDNLIIIKQ